MAKGVGAGCKLEILPYKYSYVNRGEVNRPRRRLLMSIPNILTPTRLVGGTLSDPSGSGLEPAWGGL